MGLRSNAIELGGDTASFLWLLTQGHPRFQRSLMEAWVASLRARLVEEDEDLFVALLGPPGDATLALALEDGAYTTLLDEVVTHEGHTEYSLSAALAQLGTRVSRPALATALRTASQHGWGGMVAAAAELCTPGVLELLGELRVEDKLALLASLPTPVPGADPLRLALWLGNAHRTWELEALYEQLVRLHALTEALYLEALERAVVLGDAALLDRIVAGFEGAHGVSLPRGLAHSAVASGSVTVLRAVLAMAPDSAHELQLCGGLQMARVLTGKQRVAPTPAPRPRNWQRASVRIPPQTASALNAAATAAAAETAPPPPPPPPPAVLALSPHAARMTVLDDSVFPNISFSRTTLVHALLQMTWDEQSTLDVVELLLEAGCEPTVGAPAPLEVAAWRGFGRVVALLLEAGASATVLAPLGWNALHIAAARGWAQIVEMLYGLALDEYDTPTWLGTRRIRYPRPGWSRRPLIRPQLG